MASFVGWSSRIAPDDDYIRSVRNQLFGPRADAFGILACETVIKMNVTGLRASALGDSTRLFCAADCVQSWSDEN
jgi:hypothetical protein